MIQLPWMAPPRTAWLLAAALLVTGWLTGGCTRQASTLPVVMPSRSAPTIGINRVRVTQETGIYILGEADLPNGKCIRTELLAEKQPVNWWPGEVCIEVNSGQWEILVPLGRRGAPAHLDESLQYEIHAWWPDDPQRATTNFPFDLSGPPEPD